MWRSVVIAHQTIARLGPFFGFVIDHNLGIEKNSSKKTAFKVALKG